MTVQMPNFPLLLKTIGTYDPAKVLPASEELHRDLCKGIANEFNKTSAGCLTLRTYVFTTEAPVDRGAPSTHTVVLLQLLDVNEPIKQAYNRMVRGLCKQTKAAIVAWASEIWHVHCTSDEEQEEMRAWREEHGGSLEGFRLSGERLICGLEVRGKGTRILCAPIIRDEKGRRAGPWAPDEALNDPGAATEGRFMRILEET